MRTPARPRSPASCRDHLARLAGQQISLRRARLAASVRIRRRACVSSADRECPRYRYFGESGGQPRQFENPEANALGVADTIKVPVLVVHSEQALTPNLAHAFHAAVNAPKHELWLHSHGQIGLLR
jgi:hypothetical protein